MSLPTPNLDDLRFQQDLATECAKLDPRVEQDLAEEGMSQELAEWPEY